MDVNMPVTIVVKAPNQKIDDQTVECALGWTVKKLKQHLSDVYPSQPKEDQQRIIYSGKLLHDHLKLKDILRRDDLGIPHTVHLVCSSTGGSGVAESTATLASSQSTPDVVGSFSSESSFTPTTLPEGLRNRMNHIQTQPNLMAYQHAFSHFPHHQQTTNGHHYTPQQMAWMQQMYAQQMAQYMQYLQHGAIPPSPTTTAPVHAVPAQAAPAAPQRAPVQNAGANQNMRMNAQGGAMMEEDEDEGVRDWLDWVYVMSRAAVLFAILYFYSTFGRFVIVFGLFILVWIYNAGLFRIRRRARRNEQEQAAQEPANQQQVQPDQQQQQQAEEVDGPPSEDDENNTENNVPELPPQPGVLKILMTFFWTFVTSLFPENPQMVN